MGFTFVLLAAIACFVWWLKSGAAAVTHDDEEESVQLMTEPDVESPLTVMECHDGVASGLPAASPVSVVKTTTECDAASDASIDATATDVKPNAAHSMTWDRLHDIRSELLADDIELDEKMLTWDEVRVVAYFEGGGIDAGPRFTPLPLVPPARPRRPYGDWLRVHSELHPGDTYGFRFPHTLELLGSDAFGAAWLTKAFRASGVLSSDNEVAAIVALEGTTGGGAAEKGLLSVRYLYPSPSLHTKLFLKFPHVADVMHKYLISCIYDSDASEVAFAQRFAARAPVRTPKTYFADRSSHSTNYLLIQERIAFAPPSAHPVGTSAEAAVLPAYAIERAYDKFLDHQIGSDPTEYYLALARALGRLCGWYKAAPDGIGAELNRTMPCKPSFAEGVAFSHPGFDVLAAFMTDAGAALFPPDMRTPAYAAQLRRELAFASEHLGTISRYLLSDADYQAYSHINANIDNAFWWRDRERTLHCGLIDFGGFCCNHVSAHLTLCLNSAEFPVHARAQPALLQAFIDGCVEQGGPQLDLAELTLRYDLALVASACHAARSVPTIYKYLRKEAWGTVRDRHDERLTAPEMDSFLARSFSMGLVTNLTRWKRHNVYQTVVDFLQSPKGQAPTPALPIPSDPS